jgi:hypothetical protein
MLRAVTVAVHSLGVSKRIDGSERDSQQKRDKHGNDRHQQLAPDAVACDIITHTFECTPKRARNNMTQMWFGSHLLQLQRWRY